MSLASGEHQSLRALLATNRLGARRWLRLRLSMEAHQHSMVYHLSRRAISHSSRRHRDTLSTRATKM
jgi:hypothetical protein